MWACIIMKWPGDARLLVKIETGQNRKDTDSVPSTILI